MWKRCPRARPKIREVHVHLSPSPTLCRRVRCRGMTKRWKPISGDCRRGTASRREEKQVEGKCRIRPKEETTCVQGPERGCDTDDIDATVNPMANRARAMVFVRPVIDRMPNLKGKRANDQDGDQGFDERMFGVEVHTKKNRKPPSKSQMKIVGYVGQWVAITDVVQSSRGWQLSAILLRQPLGE